MKNGILIFITIFLSFISCKETTNSTNIIHDTIVIQTDTLVQQDTVIENDVTNYVTVVKLPTLSLTKEIIEQRIKYVNSLVSNEKAINIEYFDGFDGHCSVNKYFFENEIILITAVCGDCSIYYTAWKYYFKNDTILYVDYEIVGYGYNPCFTDEELIEYGITDEYKKEHYQKRTDKYFLTGTNDFIFERSGFVNNLNFSDDTLTIEMIIELAEDLYLAQDTI